MQLLQTPTGPIAYDIRGRGGDPLVLLPSGAHDHHGYDELRDLLPARFRSISLDWPSSEAARITAPTLLFWGRRDPVIPPKIGEQLQRTIPGARLVLFDAGHVPHTTDPAGVAAELVPFAEAAFAASPSREGLTAPGAGR